jgi:DNA-binding NarL/FixJ family response regulator
VVSDIGMPKLIGLRVAQELANRAEALRVAIYPAETDIEVVQAARNVGALAYGFQARIESAKF